MKFVEFNGQILLICEYNFLPAVVMPELSYAKFNLIVALIFAKQITR
jgi:hypothetical protein